MITQDELKKLFDYKDGHLIYKVNVSSRGRAGNRLGHIRADGYVVARINGKHYYLHRLIFLYHAGHVPEYVDHIDGNKSNNNISNLREATKTNNQQNQKGSNKTSKYKGVHWSKKDKRWVVQIMYNGERVGGGSFTSELEAAKRYNELAKIYHKEFAYLNEV